MSILITSILNCASDRLAISSSLSWILEGFNLFFHLGHIFLSPCTCYVVRGETLGILQDGVTHVSALWPCMWGWGLRGNNATCSALGWISVSSLTTHKQNGPFCCWFPGGWVCVCSRTLWVSPMNSPVRLEVSPAITTPQVFTARFWGFISQCWSPRLHHPSHSPVVPPSLSVGKCGISCSASHWLTYSGPPATNLPWVLSTPAAPPASLDECFFFNSLVVGLLYSAIFWLFWLLFVFKFVVVLLLAVWRGRVYLPTPPSMPQVPD